MTGCNGGIGHAICLDLQRNGDKVIGLDLVADGENLEPNGIDLFIQCDLADEKSIAAALDNIAKEKAIGCLVNCAGIYKKQSVFDTTLEDFDHVMAINLRAPFQISQAIGRNMADNHGGSIINIASINGKLGSPIVSYGTSKAGLIGLTKSLAKTLAPYNIRVNAIAPGTIQTPMVASVDAKQMERQMYNIAMERVGEPQEIAGVVRFLASDESSYMTGSVVDVAGGWMS